MTDGNYRSHSMEWSDRCTCDGTERDDNIEFPLKPEKPLDSDCCGSGCVPCVLDIYEQELRIWEDECRKLSKCKICAEADEKQAPELSTTEYRQYEIAAVTDLTDNTRIYRFHLHKDKSLGLKIGQHVIVRVQNKESRITRQYTPISSVANKGYFDLMIKIYSDGRMSQHIKTWKPGDMVDIRGPHGEFDYIANKYRKIYLLAAGTGIAPMAQVIQGILDNEEDETFIHLIYSCVNYKNILLKQQLNEWTRFWNFSVLYCLTQENTSETNRKYAYGDRIHLGRIEEKILKGEIGLLSDNILVLICGTRSFDDDMKQYFMSNGVQSENMHKF